MSERRKLPYHPKDFGRRIRRARKTAGMTQVQLGKASGLSQTFISEVENGHRNPTMGPATLLALALSVSLDHLVGLESDSEPETAAHTPGPWYVDTTDPGLTVREQRGRHQIVVLNPCREEYKANASVIAAAPRMLKALRRMCVSFRFARGASDHHTSLNYREAREAIAEAETVIE